MVLLPCGACCCNAGQPFDSMGAASSIEVDITQATNHDYIFSGAHGYASSTITVTAKLPPITGTYSLAPVAGYDGRLYRYEDANVFMEFERESGVSAYQTLRVAPAVSSRGVIVTGGGATTTKDAKGGWGSSLTFDCNTSRQIRYVLQSYWVYLGGNLVFVPQVGSFLRPSDQSGSFPVDCRLPVIANGVHTISLEQASSYAWTTSTQTFPTYSMTADIFGNKTHFYSFGYSLRVDACRVIYPGATVTAFDGLSPAGCAGYP